jgi:hypothetical protein
MAHGPATSPMPAAPKAAARPYRRVILWMMIGLLVLGALAAELAWWRWTATATDFDGAHFNQGRNATWLAHTWVGDDHSDADYAALAALVQREQITYLYAHVGPLNGDGTISPGRYPYAEAFARALHADDPGVQILAWMGQINDEGSSAGSDNDIDISLPGTQQNIADTAAIFTGKLGFDGVHLDIEPVLNNDRHFLDLLDVTRQAIGGNKILSIATPNWVVARASEFIDGLTGHPNNWWTTYYFQVVSHHADQIVVMLYNTGMPTAPLYEALVQQETVHVLRDVQLAGSQASVLIGIPTYTGGTTRSFHDSAENMHTGLAGIINGLNTSGYIAPFTGVAIYAEWVTTSGDWSTYNDLWLGSGS